MARQLLTGVAQPPDSVKKFRALMKDRPELTSEPTPTPKRIINPPPREKPSAE
jgi:hypothetical protein